MSQIQDEYRFVELDRSFYELREDSIESDSLLVRRALQSEEKLRWADLTQEYRVIILSEAGTGKTEEIRHLATTLREDSKPAFFLRLEHIPNDFDAAFEVGSVEEFSAWLASGDEGWVLLDSVDEAKLRHPGDFALAVKKVGHRIRSALQRVHIVITGRTTSWRKKNDLDLCITTFPYQRSTTTMAKEEKEFDEHEEEDDRDEFVEVELDTNRKLAFRIVAFNDLDREQIERFAAARGVKETKAFLSAVERADAWSFTARPQDLEDLVEFWNDHGQIGSRLQIIQNSIERRLLERDQNRADAKPLSSARAKEGVRLLAAACTLCQERMLRIPDGADNSKGMSAGLILSDWNDKDLGALLSRPIFDEAIYGTVRFHHRSVSEFLTAEWLGELFRRETSRRNIESLLFRNQYGLDVVVPAMRPILPWLAILDEKTCRRLHQLAPEILLEDGDPSKLPLDLRRSILRQVCDQLANGESSRTMIDYAAVQRFADTALASDVKELISKHAANDDVLTFLLRMIWLGQLKEGLPEAKRFARSRSSSKYARISAIQAVKAVGSAADLEEIRTSFLGESSELNRELLTEFLDDLEPTPGTVKWLLDSLAKTPAAESSTVDGLADAVAAFVSRAQEELLPNIVAGLDPLLDTAPVVERRECEISQRFAWLIGAAARAVQRLIEARHSASLSKPSLAVVHKFGVSRRSDLDDYSEREFEFSTLVPAWPELNRACFWYDVERARELRDKKQQEGLTEIHQVLMYGSFWKFDESDFDYAVQEIGLRQSYEEKALALSLAFRLYVKGGRDSKQRYRLKKAAGSDNDLTAQLGGYLKPPARGRQSYKQLENRHKRRSEKRQQQVTKNFEQWRTYLRANADKLRNNGFGPGQLSNAQSYLHDRVREKSRRSKRAPDRWAASNWKSLAEDYGEEVARAYRDGAVGFWREYTPELRSEGAPPNSIPHATIFGLGGIQIEAAETPGWPNKLSTEEVRLACRYASYEMNGFPTWLPVLFETFPPIVEDFLLKEIRYELQSEKANVESHYLLADVSWSGQWAWNALAPSVLSLLKAKEPTNLSNLDRLLTIVQGSSVTDDELAKLASRKCKRLKRLDHLAPWFAVWVGVDPSSAIPALESRCAEVQEAAQRTTFAMQFITRLLGGRRGSVSNVRTTFRTPEHLKRLYFLMLKSISMKEDIKRTGAYSPGLRDDAQRARDYLAESIRSTPGKEAYLALMEIGKAHPEEAYKPWFTQQAKSKAESDADLVAWTPRQVREFHEKLERTPENHRDLADLAHLRLLDLKDDLENGDSSIAAVLQGVGSEVEMRKFIGNTLRDKAFGRFSIPQEEEFADAKRPDLRFHGACFDGPVPCELKLVDNNWSGAALFERMENQLCGDYLRDNRSNRGFLILVYQGRQKTWRVPGATKPVDFEALVTSLREHWEAISSKYECVEQIEVIGIDLTKRLK